MAQRNRSTVGAAAGHGARSQVSAPNIYERKLLIGGYQRMLAFQIQV
ncbi:MAG: hypothetical protein ABFD44_00225 [Anaerolineaceae bacterium]